MLGETLQLPDHAVSGALQPGVEALGSMVTNQAGRPRRARPPRPIQERGRAAQPATHGPPHCVFPSGAAPAMPPCAASAPVGVLRSTHLGIASPADEPQALL